MIFVDTSAWLALADSHDRNHGSASALHRRIAKGEFGQQVTSNYVMAEAVTMIRRRIGLEPAIALSEAVREGNGVGLFWVEPVHHREAVELMASHSDKQWSVTDCSSFVIMRSLGIRDAFSFDQDFVQAGFTAHP
ncbi:MAG: type II toxin-antitoxin system VapC family toxin [Thermoplasmata archaeon]